jgi:hypothetical protein
VIRVDTRNVSYYFFAYVNEKLNFLKDLTFLFEMSWTYVGREKPLALVKDKS